MNKYLAHCGVCSRRDADKLIEKGQVLVNGRTALPGMAVGDGDEVLVSGRRVSPGQETVVLAFYKPLGVTCTEKDRFAEKKITDMVKYPVRVTYAGRLDKEAHGLILLTNDGELIDAMMRGSAGHEKEYIVKVKAGRYCKEITEDFLAKMRAGVYLPELEITTKPCKIEKTGKFSFKIILTQGGNRQIRRMTRELGYHVETIKRTRVVNIRLGDLKPGEYRPLKGEELHELYHICMGH